MNNKIVIALFLIFAIIVFFSSLQTVANTTKLNTLITAPLVTLTPTPTVATTPTAAPSPTFMQLPPAQHVGGFKVNGGGEGGDD